MDDVLLTTTLHLSQVVYGNSNAIVLHWGNEDRSIATNYTMVDDFYVSNDRKLNFSGGTLSFNGQGNYIRFANSLSNAFNIPSGTNVQMSNVILHNFQFSEFSYFVFVVLFLLKRFDFFYSFY